jgi:hypothetical protein
MVINLNNISGLNLIFKRQIIESTKDKLFNFLSRYEQTSTKEELKF